MNNIPAGAYRELFIKALTFYEAHAKHTPEELAAIRYYATLLHNPDYQFGKVNHSEIGYTTCPWYWANIYTQEGKTT